MFSDYIIAQNLIGLIFAGGETTALVAHTLSSIFAQKPEILAKVRTEFREQIRKPAEQEDPSLKGLPLREFLD